MTRKITVRDLRAGMRLEVDRMAPDEDPSDFASIYEEVVYVEPLGQAYLVQTEGRAIQVLENAELNVEESDDVEGPGDGVPPAAAG